MIQYRPPTIPHQPFRLACLLCCWGLSALTTAQAAEFTSVVVGYQGQGQIASWLPVSVRATGFEPGTEVRLMTRAVDARGNPTININGRAVANVDGEVSLRGSLRTGRLDVPVQVQIVSQDRQAPWCEATINCSTQPNPSEQDVQAHLQLFRRDVTFLLSVGSQPAITEFLERMQATAGGNSRLVGSRVEAIAEFPSDARDLAQFAAIAIDVSAELSATQLSALQEWTRAGGKLLVSGQDNVDSLHRSEFGAWLNHWFDIAPEMRRVSAPDLRAIQQQLHGSTNILLIRDYSDLYMAQINSKHTEILATSPLSPSVARIRTGNGSITFVAVDFGHPVLSRWQSLPEFYGQLIFDELETGANNVTRSSRISHTGVGDLSTQLMATIDPASQTAGWSAWNVIGLACGWLLLIGPIDYLLVAILLKRPHWTWITFPMWVIAAMAGLYWLSPVERPAVTANAVHLMDVTGTGEQQYLNVRSFGSISTSETCYADLTATISADLPLPETSLRLQWSGRAENVYGGMYRTRGLGGISDAYVQDLAESATLRAVPMLVDGSFETESHYAGKLESPLFQSSLEVEGIGLLNGHIRHHFPVSVEDWYIVYGNRVYRPRGDVQQAWPADSEWSFERSHLQVSDLKSWLVGDRRRQGAAPGKDSSLFGTAIRYDSSGRDAVDIVTMISLYHAAGATTYCGLSNDYLQQMDLSSVINSSRALLIGRLNMDAVQIQFNGELVQPAGSSTVLRMMIPVDRVASTDDNDVRVESTNAPEVSEQQP